MSLSLQKPACPSCRVPPPPRTSCPSQAFTGRCRALPALAPNALGLLRRPRDALRKPGSPFQTRKSRPRSTLGGILVGVGV